MGGDLSYTALRCVRLLVWTPARRGGDSSWRVLGGIWGGRGSERDVRIDRWKSCVWRAGYTHANPWSFIPSALWNVASDGQSEEGGTAAGVSLF